MLAFITNLSWGEMLVAAMIAVLIFGRNLPEVAGRVYAQLRKVRQAVDDMRRETGIDRDMRELNHSLRDIQQEARIADPLRHANKTSSSDFVRHLDGGMESDPATSAGEEPPAAPPGPPLGQPMDDGEPPLASAREDADPDADQGADAEEPSSATGDDDEGTTRPQPD